MIWPKVKEHLKMADMEKEKEDISEERWHGQLLQARWQNSGLSQRVWFAQLRDWTCPPTHTIAAVNGALLAAYTQSGVHSPQGRKSVG